MCFLLRPLATIGDAYRMLAECDQSVAVASAAELVIGHAAHGTILFWAVQGIPMHGIVVAVQYGFEVLCPMPEQLSGSLR